MKRLLKQPLNLWKRASTLATQWTAPILVGVLLALVAILVVAPLTIIIVYDALLILPGQGETTLASLISPATAILNVGILAALALTTWNYARSTQKIAKEAEETRLDTHRPVLVLGSVGGKGAEFPISPPSNAEIGQPSSTSVGVRWRGWVANVGPGPAIGGSILIRIGNFPREKQGSGGGVNKVELPPIASRSVSRDDIDVYVALSEESQPPRFPEQGELIVTCRDIYGRYMQTRYPLALGELRTGPSGQYRLGVPEITVGQGE